MKRLRQFSLAASLLTTVAFTSCELFEDGSTPGLTESEIIQGLKEALSIGLNSSVVTASTADGYLKNEIIKIILPEEVSALQNSIQTDDIAGIPLSLIYTAYINVENDGNDLFDDLVTAMNRGAENAADEALPIFGNAITNMTISDARGILDGDETAATDFFFQETNQELFTAFNPDVKSALDATGANQIYTSVVGFINFQYDPTGLGLTTISPSEILNTGNLPASIDEYATTKAIDGLFYLVGEEEKKIRLDPFAWGSSIIERVFGSS